MAVFRAKAPWKTQTDLIFAHNMDTISHTHLQESNGYYPGRHRSQPSLQTVEMKKREVYVRVQKVQSIFGHKLGQVYLLATCRTLQNYLTLA